MVMGRRRCLGGQMSAQGFAARSSSAHGCVCPAVVSTKAASSACWDCQLVRRKHAKIPPLTFLHAKQGSG